MKKKYIKWRERSKLVFYDTLLNKEKHLGCFQPLVGSLSSVPWLWLLAVSLSN